MTVFQKIVREIKRFIKKCASFRFIGNGNKKKEIINYFKTLDKNNQDSEVLEVIRYFQNNPFSIFPYDFTKKYIADNIDVFTDKKENMMYILHENKRMYFPKGWEKCRIQNYYNRLLIEQDIDSPHRYENDAVHVNNGDIVADIGTAEGIFALSNIEKAKKIYLFECDNEWINVLEKTFEPWKEKIVIVNKFISDHTKGDCITLDDYFNENEINFIKADIEGDETRLLQGAKQIFARVKKLQMVLCAYHKEKDAEELQKELTAQNFRIEFSKRYMIFIYDSELQKPYLRRGIIRASKI
ncbi:MAG: FkbM family methyltransferase [Planctomycetaceae bacterium]|jgi:predicted RNA methylase|nr:FkbM family methyltransferase [Planctomycetaceae bacterium]